MRILPSLGLLLLVVWPMPAQEAPDRNSADSLRKESKKVLAQLEGKVALAGLQQPVEVLRDRWGIAHIYAANTHDLFFAQGLVAAQDRLFQLELWRRQARGEMAALLGPQAVEAD